MTKSELDEAKHGKYEEMSKRYAIMLLSDCETSTHAVTVATTALSIVMALSMNETVTDKELDNLMNGLGKHIKDAIKQIHALAKKMKMEEGKK